MCSDIRDRIPLFLREVGLRVAVPEREDLFFHQISRLDRDYDLEKKWNTFNFKLDSEFQGNTKKFKEAWDRYCTGLIDYYTKNQVVSKVNSIVGSQNLIGTDISNELLAGHSYLKLDLVHAYDQVLENYNLLPKSEVDFRKDYTDSSLLLDSKVARIVSYSLIKVKAIDILAEQLLKLAVADQKNKLINQIDLMGIPIVRKDLDDYVYDITGFEDTFSPFIGQQILNGVKLNVSIFKQNSLIYYYDYALRMIPVQTDFESEKKLFGNNSTKEFLPQFVCLDKGEPIQEKDLWWQDREGLYRHNKPIQQVFLGPETVVN